MRSQDSPLRGRGIVPTSGPGLPSVDLLLSARRFAAASKSARTRRAYRSAWGVFLAFCQSQDLPALPASPATVSAFLAARADAGRKVATLGLDLTAISQAHLAGEFPDSD